ncbi:hypothetical protein OG361_37465 [Streptomyces sp. NBC_00090]|uniref:hypothetical protein n=1 Tax=Streptomyces sp. NBC_00090 TaxID=2903619 RepID=UPI003249111B
MPARRQQPLTAIVLPRDLDIEHGELTPSLKVKRPVVEREYAEVIETVYEGAREA